ncbi:hypothetical protein BH18VER1_BH18VER1_05800 [soil metagenome]
MGNFRDRYGDWGRDLALWLGRTQCGMTLRELGEEAGWIDYATVSAATARWKKRVATDRKLMEVQNRALAHRLHDLCFHVGSPRGFDPKPTVRQIGATLM